MSDAAPSLEPSPSPNHPSPISREPRQTVRLVSLALLMRLTVDTTMRMFYPYLPEISRGLGISLSMGGLLVSVRSATLMSSPLFGLWNDRHGPRGLLAGALLVQGASLWWMSGAQNLAAALPAMLILGLTAAAFVPILQATISEHVPFHRRGRVLGIVEFSWAVTGILLLPFVGWLMVQQGWQAPLRLVALLSLAVAPLAILLPGRRHRVGQARASLHQVMSSVWKSRSARAAITANALMFVAAESFFVTYGAWLERIFGMAPDAVGRIAGMLGVAELAGSGVSSLLLDRVGKRRGVGAGLLGMALTVALLPWLESSLGLATAGLLAFTLCFEFSIVSNISLMSEQVPQARGTALSIGVMAGALTRTISGLGGVALFEWQGMLATSTIAALSCLVAFRLVQRQVLEQASTSRGQNP